MSSCTNDIRNKAIETAKTVIHSYAKQKVDGERAQKQAATSYVRTLVDACASSYFHFQRHLQRIGSRQRGVAGLATLAVATILLANCGADNSLPPSAQQSQGICEGLRGAGNIDARRPIAVTAQSPNGETALFRCEPISDWLSPVARTTQWQQSPANRSYR
jgi:hypothetical protein